MRLVSNNSRSVLMHIELIQVLTVKMGGLFSLSRLLARRSKQISMHFPMTINVSTFLTQISFPEIFALALLANHFFQ